MQTRPIGSVILSLVGMFALVIPAAAQTAATGRVVGYAYTANNSAIVDASVQLRSTVSGQVEAVTRTTVTGEFVFGRVPPGSYVIEMVNAAGGVMALGNPFTLAAGEVVATFVRMGTTLPVLIAERPWDLAIGALAAWRGGSDGLAAGGGVGIGYRAGRLTPFVEASGTRRNGHNDWHAVAGLRLWLKEWADAGLFVQGGAGTLIRNSDAGPAFSTGVGVEWRMARRVAFRLRGDLTRDRANDVTATGARGSIWAVVR